MVWHRNAHEREHTDRLEAALTFARDRPAVGDPVGSVEVARVANRASGASCPRRSATRAQPPEKRLYSQASRAPAKPPSTTA